MIDADFVEKLQNAELKNIVQKVKDGKTLNQQERKLITEAQAKPWEELEIHKTTYYKYLKLGMPEEKGPALEWIAARAGLARQGSGKIEIGGRTFTAQDLIDLRGKVLEGQANNLKLKNKIEKLNVEEREGRLVDIDELNQVLSSILYPLKKALDQMPENISTALNPEDPTRAETILEQELENIYADLIKTLEKDERTKRISDRNIQAQV